VLAQEPTRNWQDSTGRFKIEAKLEAVEGDMAVLSRVDGKTIRVPINRLSESDQAYLVEFGSSKKTALPHKEAVNNKVKEKKVPLTEVLKKAANVSFSNTPLSECVDILRQQHSINAILLVNRTEEKKSTWLNTEITYQSKIETVEEVLNSILSPLSLEWFSFDGVLVIAADPKLTYSNRVYRVKEARFVQYFNFRGIMNKIGNIDKKSFWETFDGDMTAIYPDRLVIHQSMAIHRELERLPDLAPVPSTFNQFRDSLNKEISVSFVDTQLSEAIQEIANKSNTKITVDKTDLAASDLTEQRYISCSLQNVRAETVLTLLLLPFDLYCAKDKAGFRIRSKEHAYTHPITVVHDLSGIPQDVNGTMSHIEKLIVQYIDENSWDLHGGDGTMRLVQPNKLSITNGEHVHFAIKKLLDEVRYSGP
jgi:hypothetical protein